MQRGGPTTFQADPYSRQEFAGTAAQTISFADPDSTLGGSYFGTLMISNSSSGGVHLASKVVVLGMLETPDTNQTRTIFGSNRDLAVRGLFGGGCSTCAGSPKLILDNVPLVVDDGFTLPDGAFLGTFRDVIWQNMNGAATQLWIRRGGGFSSNNGSIVFQNLTFSQTLTTGGLYVHLTQTDEYRPLWPCS